MRTFADGAKETKGSCSACSARAAGERTTGRSERADRGGAGSCTPPRLSFNIGAIPIYAPAPPPPAAARAGGGAPARGESSDGEPRIGRAEVPVGTPGPLRPGDTYAVPHNFVGPLAPGVVRSNSFHPTMTVTTPGRRTADCGANVYSVRWGIPASEATSSGWIVQRVNETFSVTDCAGTAVTPHPVDDPAGYPFWEAWEFTAGQNVWVGPASGGARHSADTFGSDDYGPGTRGRVTITGEVKALVGFTLPAGMTVRNAMPAWSLPYTRTAPPAFASSLPGAAHTLTAEWNCCPRGTVTQATTVSTNP